jgi:hypothetical protein
MPPRLTGLLAIRGSRDAGRTADLPGPRDQAFAGHEPLCRIFALVDTYSRLLARRIRAGCMHSARSSNLDRLR